MLLVYALIDRPYILDLIPGNSFVEYLVQQGLDVYLLDWGVPGDEDHALSFGDYVFDYLAEAVGQVLRTSGAEAVTLFGACIGGLLAAMYAALFPGPHLRNLILHATPVDCSPSTWGAFAGSPPQAFAPNGWWRSSGTCPPSSSAARPAR